MTGYSLPTSRDAGYPLLFVQTPNCVGRVALLLIYQSNKGNFSLNSFRPIPCASYQCTSSRVDRTIDQAYCGDALPFSPSSLAVGPLQTPAITNTEPRGDWLDRGDVDDLKVHGTDVSTATLHCTAIVGLTSVSVDQPNDQPKTPPGQPKTTLPRSGSRDRNSLLSSDFLSIPPAPSAIQGRPVGQSKTLALDRRRLPQPALQPRACSPSSS